MIHPYYRGFKGELIIQQGVGHDVALKYNTKGIVEIINTFERNGQKYSTIQITELLIYSWTENHKKYLMDLEETEQIENVNYSGYRCISIG